eukprot:m.297697 g.297697  ORF g.297697 m.297697 type:complete len:54 (-) comp273268_c0_seq1:114-275(-)
MLKEHSFGHVYTTTTIRSIVVTLNFRRIQSFESLSFYRELELTNNRLQVPDSM